MQDSQSWDDENGLYTASHVIESLGFDFTSREPLKSVDVTTSSRVIALPMMSYAALPESQRTNAVALLAAGGREATSCKSLELPVQEQAVRVLREKTPGNAVLELDRLGIDAALLQLKPVGPEGPLEAPGFPVLTGQVARVAVDGKVAVALGVPSGLPGYCTFRHFVDDPDSLPEGPNVIHGEAVIPFNGGDPGGLSGGPVLVSLVRNEVGGGGKVPLTL